jgi:malonyl-CoA/methylmalonyl-CoA synthetase
VVNLELFTRAAAHDNRVAVVDNAGPSTYRQLLERSAAIGTWLAERTASDASSQPRIAYLLSAGFEHVATQWGIWRAGAIGVPLSSAQAPAEWAYAVADSQASLVIVEAASAAAMRAAVHSATTRVVTTGELARLDGPVSGVRCPESAPGLEALTPNTGARMSDNSSRQDALILYTSGTTGKPKGVVLTHANLEAQVRCLVAAWEWRREDRILHVLPLNHVHGIVNVLTCALWAGATCEMLPKFDAEGVWDVLATGRLTLFMAVPTIYSRLIAAWERATPARRRAMSNGCRALRLMVSGSAALPVRVLERWREIGGHVLLERYGMTEIGMALANPLNGVRRPGSVGTPLRGVQVQIVDEQGAQVPAGVAGELEVRGPGVFGEYWQRPEATAAAFRNGWFRTGDVAVLEDGMYRLLGRQSVDIIKSGGYKISALEIEEVLREHPAISECAVVGIEDPEWGEVVAVAAVPRGDGQIELEPLREWSRARLARYKLPSRLLLVRELPRNAMGKVSKKAVKELFAGGQEPRTG